MLISCLVILIWIIKIPLMRASGYGYLIGSLIFLFLSFLNIIRFNNLKRLKLTIIILISLPLILMNSQRIYREINKYDTKDIFFFTDYYGIKGNQSIYKNLKLVTEYKTKEKTRIKSKFNYFIIKIYNFFKY